MITLSFLTLMTLSSPQRRLKAPGTAFAQTTTTLPIPAVFAICGLFHGRCRACLPALPSLQNRGTFSARFSLSFLSKNCTRIFLTFTSVSICLRRCFPPVAPLSGAPSEIGDRGERTRGGRARESTAGAEYRRFRPAVFYQRDNGIPQLNTGLPRSQNQRGQPPPCVTTVSG
jgi:hypothetical protein